MLCDVNTNILNLIYDIYLKIQKYGFRFRLRFSYIHMASGNWLTNSGADKFV